MCEASGGIKKNGPGVYFEFRYINIEDRTICTGIFIYIERLIYIYIDR